MFSYIITVYRPTVKSGISFSIIFKFKPVCKWGIYADERYLLHGKSRRLKAKPSACGISVYLK